jgi:hypothetical protein
MPENKLEQLKRICCLGDDRPHLAKPFLVDVDGKPWSVATDSKMILAFAGRVDGVEALANPKEYQPMLQYIAGLIVECNSAADACDLNKLRAFAGAPNRPRVSICQRCNGTGTACSCGECECPDDCDKGEVRHEPEQRYGYINGRYCDLNRVAWLLDGLSGPAHILLSGDSDNPFLWSGTGWCAVLMPCRELGDEQECPRWSSQ